LLCLHKEQIGRVFLNPIETTGIDLQIYCLFISAQRLREFRQNLIPLDLPVASNHVDDALLIGGVSITKTITVFELLLELLDAHPNPAQPHPNVIDFGELLAAVVPEIVFDALAVFSMATVQEIDDFLFDLLVLLVDHDKDVILVVLEPLDDVHLLAGDVVLDLAQLLQALLFGVPEVGLPDLAGTQRMFLDHQLPATPKALETGTWDHPCAVLGPTPSQVLLQSSVSAHLINFILYSKDKTNSISWFG
jgi:hypothetical protein